MRQNLQKNNITFLMLLAGATVCILVNIQGCNRSEQQHSQIDASKTVNNVVKLQSKSVQRPASSSQKLASPPINQFDFSTKKDPFKPYAVIKSPSTTTEGLPKDLKNVLPIHSFDVSQFKLIGIISGGKENQAMVTDPNGKGYVLKPGMTIGKNDGRITSVSNNGVEILEQFRDDNGRVRKEHIKITLPRKY